VRLWRALVAVGFSPHVPNAAGETAMDLLRIARERAAQLTQYMDKAKALAALDLWDALYAEGGAAVDRHPMAVATEAAIAEAREREEREFLFQL
jgi:hypothetical protein